MAIRSTSAVVLLSLLLQLPPHSTVVTQDGDTPLHNALWKDHVQVAMMLLAKGADVTAKNNVR
jgi:ankyrin repeat protein